MAVVSFPGCCGAFVLKVASRGAKPFQMRWNDKTKTFEFADEEKASDAAGLTKRIEAVLFKSGTNIRCFGYVVALSLEDTQRNDRAWLKALDELGFVFVTSTADVYVFFLSGGVDEDADKYPPQWTGATKVQVQSKKTAPTPEPDPVVVAPAPIRRVRPADVAVRPIGGVVRRRRLGERVVVRRRREP